MCPLRVILALLSLLLLLWALGGVVLGEDNAVGALRRAALYDERRSWVRVGASATAESVSARWEDDSGPPPEESVVPPPPPQARFVLALFTGELLHAWWAGTTKGVDGEQHGGCAEAELPPAAEAPQACGAPNDIRTNLRRRHRE
jgi:hypothetical protein